MPRLKIFALAAAATVVIESACHAGIMHDDFTDSGELNATHWATQSEVLTVLAHHNHRGAGALAPILRFGSEGMEMSGVTGQLQLAGISSVDAFTAPLSLSVTVEGLVANGNAFAVYLVAKDLTRWFSIQGNLNPANRPYYGILLTSAGSTRLPSNSILCDTPSVNVPYTVRITIDEQGSASVSLMNGSATLASRNGLPIGRDPLHLALAQREGRPHTIGPNVAIWKEASITTSWTIAREDTTTHPGDGMRTLNSFRPIFHDLIAPAQYQLQVSSNLYDWADSGEAVNATNATLEFPQGWDTTDAPQLFFRLKRIQ